ncbi:hypothetical protein RJ640_000670 [Escallonia rubra]|uniref:Uncharacterized protein n=1 Tax=Escallonia rubra TaxID=112253 RepID=A0AA88U991_9ASTE|nr:hypothetical protein RJ640_000670 [Escallonia rubra]
MNSGCEGIEAATAEATSAETEDGVVLKVMQRRDYDITFEVLYCGICHSDLDMVKNEWGITQYPVLPGFDFNYFSTLFPSLVGYSAIIVANEHFVVQWPENMPLDVDDPLLCAGITVYSPLKHFGLDKPGMHLDVVGLDGLGHVVVKFVNAFGANVTVISTSPSKKEEAIKLLGADSFLVSRDPDEMQVDNYFLCSNISVTSLNFFFVGYSKVLV